jgi:hypothetical protein
MFLGKKSLFLSLAFWRMRQDARGFDSFFTAFLVFGSL